ncbi:exosortase V [Sandarakinorhabdus sp.]|uniref:exosortase V n=1 Tax=Sandarakinorhabdus sp. TaxID=1916663 RepID=UPI00333F7829
MNSETGQPSAAATTAKPANPDLRAFLIDHWPLAIGLIALASPTIGSLGQGPWQQESGVHGVIVLVTGIWLIVRRWADIAALRSPGSPVVTAMLLAAALPLYIAGRAFDFISIEAAALLLAGVAVMQQYWGMAAVRLLWFPILYLGFVVPIPGWLLDTVTLPLKVLVSELVTGTLAEFGYPVGRLGVTLYIASYQLLMEDACAGLNSLVSLSAIGLFYVYLIRGANPVYSLLLLAMVIPIAIAANCVRVAVLVLITYYLGNAMAQGYLHNFAGMVTFVSALLFVFLLDWLMTPLRQMLERKSAAA